MRRGPGRHSRPDDGTHGDSPRDGDEPRAPTPTATTGPAAPQGSACPADYPIKGNASSRIDHVPGGASYNQTKPEDCFATEAAAQAAGYRRARR